MFEAGIDALCCADFWHSLDTELKAALGIRNDFVDPKSIRTFKLDSGKTIYDNLLESTWLNEISWRSTI